MSCKVCRFLLLIHAGGVWFAGDWIAAHIARCSSCRAYGDLLDVLPEDFERDGELLASGFTTAMHSRVMSHIENNAVPSDVPLRRWTIWLRVAATVMAVAGSMWICGRAIRESHIADNSRYESYWIPYPDVDAGVEDVEAAAFSVFEENILDVTTDVESAVEFLDGCVLGLPDPRAGA